MTDGATNSDSRAYRFLTALLETSVRVLVCLIVCWIPAQGSPGPRLLAAAEGEATSQSSHEQTTQPARSIQGVVAQPIHDLQNSDEDLVELERPLMPPDDPCLSPLYRDWGEYSQHTRETNSDKSCAAVRIVVDRATFQIMIECLKRDGSADSGFTSEVGIGDVSSPTPEGTFIVNHIYCYPDVMYFGQKNERIPALYNGFFAPLLSCDESGRCQRHRDLGIHGFQASAHPNSSHIRPETFGAVSAGCIRVPDPCKMKRELIRLVGVGPLRRNDRGFYHWLNRPVEVVVTGTYPGDEDGASVAGILEQGWSQVERGLKNLFDLFSDGDRAR